jgi:UrcA family protein
MRTLIRTAAAAAALTAAAAFGAPAHAQYATPYADPYVDEVVVTGPAGRDGPRRLSQRVSYADLDLATHAGQDVLRLRIRDTARSLCRALGEDRFSAGPLTPSCEAEAIRDARGQVKHAVRLAYLRGERTYYADASRWPD